MLYIGIIIGIIAIIWLKVNKSTEVASKKNTGTRIILFLLGIMILAEIGKSKVFLFGEIGDVAFVILIIVLGYGLFKKLFMK